MESYRYYQRILHEYLKQEKCFFEKFISFLLQIFYLACWIVQQSAWPSLDINALRRISHNWDVWERVEVKDYVFEGSICEKKLKYFYQNMYNCNMMLSCLFTLIIHFCSLFSKNVHKMQIRSHSCLVNFLSSIFKY